jgi:hypothetical protein
MSNVKGDFATGLKDFWRQGALVAPMRWNKNVASLLLEIIREEMELTSIRFPEEHSQAEDDFQNACHFIFNHVYCRYPELNAGKVMHYKVRRLSKGAGRFIMDL